jgi:adenosylcobinamide kinase / adenosylcobinamide-phosphate guanylyltransferase
VPARAALTLVTGGIRSGKSELAESLAGDLGERIAYVATGVPIDSEMRERIEQHRSRRPATWITLEVGAQTIADAIRPHAAEVQGMLLDDLGSLAARALRETGSSAEADAWLQREEQALWSLLEAHALPTVVVTGEVGLALVPVNELGRRFTDVLGNANQRWAARAESLILVVAGVPWRLK